MKKTASASMLFALLTASGFALAKLPAQSPEAQAAAAAAKDKASWTEKVAAYKLCLAQNKTADHYYNTKNKDGKPSVSTPPCTDPGPYVASQVAANVGVADSKPVPAAGKPPTPPAKK